MNTRATGGHWAKLRQVVIATTTHSEDVEALQSALGLGDSFADPEVVSLSMHDATFPISADRYLEVVGPTTGVGAVAAWLSKVGGRGGYVLSVQHPDPEGVRERCLDRGVRIAIDTKAYGRTVLMLHPKDVGLVLEVDGIADPDAWFWDDLDVGPASSATVDEVVGVEVPVADPSAMTTLWAELMGIEPVADDEFNLGGAWVRFVSGGPSSHWTIVLRRASDAATVPLLAGITFQLI